MDAGTFTQKKGSMMAEEEFDVNDMPTTDRYRIPYPGADNLVRFAADQFGAMAQAIDTQLGNVDDRATDKAHATIVRNTLTELQQTDPVQGQLGYVTADPTMDNIGLWMWNGSSWSKVSGATPLTVVKPNLTELQKVSDLSEGVFGLVTSDPIATNNGVYVWSNSVWSPITGTAGGTLAADTLEQLESTPAPTGTLAYVSNDPKTSNNGVYVRDADARWTPVGSVASADFLAFTIPHSTSGLFDIIKCKNSGKYMYIGALSQLGTVSVSTGAIDMTPTPRTLTVDGLTYDNVPTWELDPGLYRFSFDNTTVEIYKSSSSSSDSTLGIAFADDAAPAGTITINGEEWTIVQTPTRVYFLAFRPINGQSTKPTSCYITESDCHAQIDYMPQNALQIELKPVTEENTLADIEPSQPAEEDHDAEPADDDAPSPVIEEDNHESQ